MTGQPHLARELAEAFGDDAERYDRARPTYAEPLIERLAAALPGRDVLDVGIGTGIAARQLEAAGCRVLGVDVDPRMAAFARSRGHEVEVAAFEDWDPAGRTFDGVVAAQTWHWVEPQAGAAKAAAVLRPGGRLTVFWNAPRPSREVRASFAAAYEAVIPDALATRAWTAPEAGESMFTTRAADGIQASGAFGEPEEWRFEWERTYTRDEWVEQMLTTPAHSKLPAEQLEALLGRVRETIDGWGGAFAMGYTTVAVTASA